ncbi:MAG TPA: amidohydrolase family protein [Pricia sp.]|nr:amidohydrolase family protein [Pricia sp.]
MEKYIPLLVLTTLFSCTNASKYYTMADYAKVDKIDTHIHVSADRDIFVKKARNDNFQLLNILVDNTRGREDILARYAKKKALKKEYPQDFEYATTFSIKEWDEPDWASQTVNWLDKNIQDGAIAVKVWKNIGMVFKDSTGRLIMVDDPKLDTIFNFLAERKIPVLGHLGEPRNCWLPLDKMTVENDKIYYGKFPEYHMYKHPTMPSYEEQIAARDRMLEKNPDLIFVGVHLGSMSWSVDEVAKHLDRFPNMAVDIAARIGQLFYQTITDREKVRDFFIKYQDRILYGTDLGDDGKQTSEEISESMQSEWITDWRFFVTDDVMTNSRVKQEFRGLKLPKEVVDKLYYKNAKKWLKMFPEENH